MEDARAGAAVSKAQGVRVATWWLPDSVYGGWERTVKGWLLVFGTAGNARYVVAAVPPERLIDGIAWDVQARSWFAGAQITPVLPGMTSGVEGVEPAPVVGER